MFASGIINDYVTVYNLSVYLKCLAECIQTVERIIDVVSTPETAELFDIAYQRNCEWYLWRLDTDAERR